MHTEALSGLRAPCSPDGAGILAAAQERCGGCLGLEGACAPSCCVAELAPRHRLVCDVGGCCVRMIGRVEVGEGWVLSVEGVGAAYAVEGTDLCAVEGVRAEGNVRGRSVRWVSGKMGERLWIY